MRNGQPLLYKVRQVLDFTTDASVSNWLFAVNFNGAPTRATTTDSVLLWNYPGVGGLQATSLLNTSNLATIWDQCRLAGVKIQYTPFAPNDATSDIGYMPGYLSWDVDGHEFDLSTMPSENLLVQASRTRVLNLYRPWKAYYKAPKRRVNSLQPTFYATPAAVALPNINIAGLWHDCNLPVAPTDKTRGAHLFFGGYNLTVSGTRYGRFLFTFYYVFKDRLD